MVPFVTVLELMSYMVIYTELFYSYIPLKREVHLEKEIQTLSSHPDVDGKSGKVFVVHKAFLELHGQTALQHSATTTEVDGDLLLCRVYFTNCCHTMWISDIRHTRS